ncbi:universal stress protein [Myxosarcina sp. GI1]|uniref:universal stress protein n=1 Tax=Myxosarcina sp. GI1 TaxID=1541065 RepID=UPI00056446BC|nr:universal stress protein [Myxosarcina sp. GI1]
MKKVLLCTDGSQFAQVSYEYVAWLATHMQIEIEVLYVTDSRKQQAMQNPDFSGSIGIDSYQHLLSQLVEVEAERAKINHKRAKIILEAAEQFFGDRNIAPVKLTHETGFLVDLFHKFEADADLVVLGKRGETADFASEHLGANMERIVRSSHRPCLVTPREFQPINRVLLAYDGGKSCQKAVRYLAELTPFNNLELHIVTVATHDDEKAQQYLTSAATAVQNNFQPLCELLHGDPEPEIEKYIAANQIDFLIMGAYGHNRIRHLIIGSTTAQMLRHSHIPILMFR